MNCYQENIKILKDKEPELVEKLEKIPFTSDSCSILDNCFTENSSSLKNCDVIVIFGFSSINNLEKITRQIPKKALILIIDHDLQNFKNSLVLYDYKNIFSSERISLAIDEKPIIATRVRMEKYFEVITVKEITIIDSYNNRSNPSYYQEIRNCLQESLMQAQQNIATMSEFASLWDNNILENINHMLLNPGLNSLRNSFHNFPAIIVSAGPSLDKNVSLLVKAKNKSLIICVDTALKTLLANNITPDIVVSIDPKEDNFMHYENAILEEITLIAESGVCPKIFSLFTNKTIFITSYGHPLVLWIESIIGQKGIFPVGGSVATTAFCIANTLGNNPIIFIGQDLSFSKDGIYSKNTSYFKCWMDSINKFNTLEMTMRNYLQEYNLIHVKGNYEDNVLTSHLMSSWIKWFGYQFKHSQSLCINATEGGAKIENCLIMSLNEALNTYCHKTQNSKDILQNIHQKHNVPDIDNFIKEMEKISNDYLLANYIACQAIETIKLLDNNPSLENHISQREIHLLQRINMLYKDLSSIENILRISRWHIEPLLSKLNSINNDSVASQIKIYKIFFQEILKISQTIENQFSKAIKKLNNFRQYSKIS
ncbi:MAG: DUF115 domain-containing protein [bacterium]|nr:DUF115 domain-containing protein [bacterium]